MFHEVLSHAHRFKPIYVGVKAPTPLMHFNIQKIVLSSHHAPVLQKISGQTPTQRFSKESIARFSVRKGQSLGFFVTLRGRRMKTFLERLRRVHLPSQRRFRGFPKASIHAQKTVTFGIPDCRTFVEIHTDEKIGLQMSFCFREPTTGDLNTFLRHDST